MTKLNWARMMTTRGMTTPQKAARWAHPTDGLRKISRCASKEDMSARQSPETPAGFALRHRYHRRVKPKAMMYSASAINNKSNEVNNAFNAYLLNNLSVSINGQLDCLSWFAF